MNGTSPDASGADDDGLNTLQPTASQSATSILLGPCVVGWMLAIFGAGCVLTAFDNYRQGVLYPRDSLRVKIALWSVTILTVVAAGLNAQETYHYLISQARDYDSIAAFTVVDCLPALPQGLVQAIVQSLLAERAMSLVHNRRLRKFIYPLYCVIACALFWSMLDVIVSYIERAGLDDRIAPLTLNIVDAVWYSLAAMIDIAIVSILLYDFRGKLKASQGARSSTDQVLRKLIRLAIITASCTTLMAIGAAISSLIATNPASVYVDVMIAFAAPLPALYSMSLFATLAARKRLREQLRGPRCACNTDVVLKDGKSRGPKGVKFRSKRPGPTATFSSPSYDSAGLPSVNITKEVHIDLAVQEPWRPHLRRDDEDGEEGSAKQSAPAAKLTPSPSSPTITELPPGEIV